MTRVFFFPDYGLPGIEKFRAYICSKRERVPAAPSFDYAMNFLLEPVTTVPTQLYRDQISVADEAMAAIDPKDTPFLAPALHLESPICSDDAHLKRQSLVPLLYNFGDCRSVPERNRGTVTVGPLPGTILFRLRVIKPDPPAVLIRWVLPFQRPETIVPHPGQRPVPHLFRSCPGYIARSL